MIRATATTSATTPHLVVTGQIMPGGSADSPGVWHSCTLLRVKMRVAAVVLCGVALSACGSGDAANPPTAVTSASSTPASTPTPTPSPSVLSQADAATRYQQINAPVAASGAAFNALYDGTSDDLAAWQSACGQVAGGYDQWARGLAGVDNWPTDAQDEVDALVAALGTSRGFYVQCQQASNMSQVYDAIGRRTGDLAGAIQNAKVALGVPSS